MGDRFEVFSSSHFVMLALFALGVHLVLRHGLLVRGTPAEESSRRMFAVAIVATAVPLQLLQFLPGDWNFNTSLPFQLCDLAWMAAAYALWTRRPWACALTYYWGLTLTSQALITPGLAQQFPHPRFIGFWAMHLLVVWAAAYMTVGVRVRPSWRLYGSTVGVTVVWAAAMMTFNVAFDTNYGYLNAKPGTGSILDLLGPWPWYVVTEIALVTVVWALITLPWTVGQHRASAEPRTAARRRVPVPRATATAAWLSLPQRRQRSKVPVGSPSGSSGRRPSPTCGRSCTTIDSSSRLGCPSPDEKERDRCGRVTVGSRCPDPLWRRVSGGRECQWVRVG